jgi:hypothetical protein
VDTAATCVDMAGTAVAGTAVAGRDGPHEAVRRNAAKSTTVRCNRIMPIPSRKSPRTQSARCHEYKLATSPQARELSPWGRRFLRAQAAHVSPASGLGVQSEPQIIQIDRSQVGRVAGALGMDLRPRKPRLRPRDAAARDRSRPPRVELDVSDQELVPVLLIWSMVRTVSLLSSCDSMESRGAD